MNAGILKVKKHFLIGRPPGLDRDPVPAARDKVGAASGNASTQAARLAKEDAMREKMGTPAARTGDDRHDDTFDMTALLHPAQAFAQPMDVISDPDLTFSEKRAILAAWASDTCAVEAVPALRCAPGHAPVQFDDIMDALRLLDRQAVQFGKPIPHYRRVLERRGASRRRNSRVRSGGGVHGPLLQ